MRMLPALTTILALSWILMVGCSPPTAIPPIPAPTANPTAPPTRVSTPLPTPTPTPRPTVPMSDLAGLAPERVIAVGEIKALNRGPLAFWHDKEPLILQGCYSGVNTDSMYGRRWHLLSQGGAFNQAHYLVAVGGNLKQVKPQKCYEFLVSKVISDSVCYVRESYSRTFPLSPYGCRGWFQETPFFLLEKGGDSRTPTIRPIDKYEVRGQ